MYVDWEVTISLVLVKTVETPYDDLFWENSNQPHGVIYLKASRQKLL